MFVFDNQTSTFHVSFSSPSKNCGKNSKKKRRFKLKSSIFEVSVRQLLLFLPVYLFVFVVLVNWVSFSLCVCVWVFFVNRNRVRKMTARIDILSNRVFGMCVCAFSYLTCVSLCVCVTVILDLLCINVSYRKSCIAIDVYSQVGTDRAAHKIETKRKEKAESLEWAKTSKAKRSKQKTTV